MQSLFFIRYSGQTTSHTYFFWSIRHLLFRSDHSRLQIYIQLRLCNTERILPCLDLLTRKNGHIEIVMSQNILARLSYVNPKAEKSIDVIETIGNWEEKEKKKRRERWREKRRFTFPHTGIAIRVCPRCFKINICQQLARQYTEIFSPTNV